MTGDGYIIVPISIRESDTVRLHFPADITADEAEKVARVIKAYAHPLGLKSPSNRESV